MSPSTDSQSDTSDLGGLPVEALWEGACAELGARRRGKPYLEEICRRAFELWDDPCFSMAYALFHQPDGRSLIARMLIRKDPTMASNPVQLDHLAQDVLAGLCRIFNKRNFHYRNLPQLFGYLDGICTRILYAKGGLRERRQKIIQAIKKGLPLNEEEIRAVESLLNGDGSSVGRHDAGQETDMDVGEDETAEQKFEMLVLFHSLRGGKLSRLTDEPAVQRLFDASSTRYVNQFLYNRQQTVIWHFYVLIAGAARDPDRESVRRIIERLVPASLRTWKWKNVPFEEDRHG